MFDNDNSGLFRLLLPLPQHNISTDGGTWYPQACKFLKLDHPMHPFYEKSIIECTVKYVKDITERFDEYFLVERKCKLEHVMNWLILFMDMHNKKLELINVESF